MSGPTKESGEGGAPELEGKPEAFQPGEISTIRRSLLDWYDRHRRDLPWRGVDDPYATWVAEIMLQQTRVSTVVDYFERWMERFPDVESVASAQLDDVLDLWEGLGYYRRARYLHRTARRLVEEFGGELPASAEQLEELTGIGPYTAGAIASIAFGEATPVVDGNVSRVLSRLRAIEGDPRSTENENRYWSLAEQLVDPDRPGDFNQGMMELGATVCTPQSPSCLLCPLREMCHGFERGEPESFPETASRATQKPVEVASCVLLAESDGEYHTYVVKRDAEGLLGGLWEFPSVRLEDEPAEEALEAYLHGELQLEEFSTIDSVVLGTLTHLFSHLRMTIRMQLRRVDEAAFDRSGPPVEQRGRGWLPLADLDAIAMSTAMRRVERRVRAHIAGVE